MMHYNPKVDIVNDNVYTNIGLNPPICSQDIEQKPNYDGMTEKENDRDNDGQGESSIAPLFQSRAIIAE